MFPTDVVERLERLIGKVGDVPDLDIAMVGCRSEEHVCHLPVIRAGADCRNDAPLGPLRVAHLDELPEPSF